MMRVFYLKKNFDLNIFANSDKKFDLEKYFSNDDFQLNRKENFIKSAIMNEVKRITESQNQKQVYTLLDPKKLMHVN